MSHKLTWVAATSTAARRERCGCGGLSKGVTAMKSKLSAALGLSLLAFTFTSTPSYAITISVTPGATTSSVPGAVLFENFDGTSPEYWNSHWWHDKRTHLNQSYTD
jgi:hypothetical protein